MNYLKEKNGTTQAYRFKNKVLKMKELASNSLCFVAFDSYQVQNLVQVIEMIQYHKSEINKIKNQLINEMKDKNFLKLLILFLDLVNFQQLCFWLKLEI